MNQLAGIAAGLLLFHPLAGAAAGGEIIKSNRGPQIVLIAPDIPPPMHELVPETVNGYLGRAFGWKIPVVDDLSESTINLVVGNEANNRVLKSLAAGGLDLRIAELGDEGFRIFSHEVDGRRLLIVAANTLQGLKHGCQELVYFRISADSNGASVDWPLDVAMKPQIAYRGVYMLPIWSAYDSLESWRRVLRFNSELTLNRVWFWLDGFSRRRPPRELARHELPL